jgi:hypothetical protein
MVCDTGVGETATDLETYPVEGDTDVTFCPWCGAPLPSLEEEG